MVATVIFSPIILLLKVSQEIQKIWKNTGTRESLKMTTFAFSSLYAFILTYGYPEPVLIFGHSTLHLINPSLFPV